MSQSVSCTCLASHPAVTVSLLPLSDTSPPAVTVRQLHLSDLSSCCHSLLPRSVTSPPAVTVRQLHLSGLSSCCHSLLPRSDTSPPAVTVRQLHLSGLSSCCHSQSAAPCLTPPPPCCHSPVSFPHLTSLSRFFFFTGPAKKQFRDCLIILLGYDQTNATLAISHCFNKPFVPAGSPTDFNIVHHFYSIGRCVADYFGLMDTELAVKQDKMRQIISNSSELSESDRKWYLANLHKCRHFDNCIAKLCNITVPTAW